MINLRKLFEQRLNEFRNDNVGSINTPPKESDIPYVLKKHGYKLMKSGHEDYDISNHPFDIYGNPDHGAEVIHEPKSDWWMHNTSEDARMSDNSTQEHGAISLDHHLTNYYK
mgnify:CR=1 FL=1